MPIIRRNIRASHTGGASNNPGILVVDDDPHFLDLMCAALSPLADEFNILKAATLQAARVEAEKSRVVVFVLDIQMPDGTGLDYSQEVKERFPDAAIMVVTGTTLVQEEEFIRRFGIDRFMRKPFRLADFRESVALLASQSKAAPQQGAEVSPSLPSEIGFPPAAPADPAARGALPLPSAALPDVRSPSGRAPGAHRTILVPGQSFHGTLRKLTTTDIIQLKCIGRSSCVLFFSNADGRKGDVVIKSGEIVHAMCGEKEGLDALYEIVAWNGGEIEERSYREGHPATIRGSWEGLLLEALRLKDEREE